MRRNKRRLAAIARRNLERDMDLAIIVYCEKMKAEIFASLPVWDRGRLFEDLR